MRRANIKFRGTLFSKDIKIDCVYCEILFPELEHGRVILKAKQLPGHSSLYKLPTVFSLKADLKNDSGELYQRISASQIYSTETRLGKVEIDDFDSCLQADILDLEIEYLGIYSERLKENSSPIFWISDSNSIGPRVSFEEYYNDNIQTKQGDRKIFETLDSHKFSIVSHHEIYRDPTNRRKRISESHLIAQFQECFTVSKKDIFSQIDIFLGIASLAERRAIVCYHYRGNIDTRVVELYRGDIYCPPESSQHDHSSNLIPLKDSYSFINESTNSIRTCPFHEHLIDAIRKIPHYESFTIESSILAYFSIIENLVTGYRKYKNLSYSLNDNEWKIFDKQIRNFIRKQSCLKKTENQENKDKRNSIYSKLSELKRIPFEYVFKSFCDDYNIKIDDLWPLFGKSGSCSLADIRNQIAHGEFFLRHQHEALVFARIHLKWIAERCILAVLHWDVHKSRVSSNFLEKVESNIYTNWQTQVKVLTGEES